MRQFLAVITYCLVYSFIPYLFITPLSFAIAEDGYVSREVKKAPLPKYSRSKRFISNLYSSYLKGLFYAESGDYRSSLEEFRKAKRLDPRSPHIRIQIASLLIRLGELEKAENELKEARKIDPDNADVSLALIFLYSYAKKDKELEREYENFLQKAHDIKPEDVKISEHLAQFYFYKKRVKEAIEIYEAITKNNPHYVNGFFWLGFLYEEDGRRKEAIEVWKSALEIDANHAPTLNSLGYIYAEEGINLDEAERMIKAAIEQEPHNGAYLDSLGWVYFKKGDYEQAEEYLKSAISVIKDPVIFEHMGDLYIKLNNFEKGISYYREGIKYFPDNIILKEKLKKYEEESESIKE